MVKRPKVIMGQRSPQVKLEGAIKWYELSSPDIQASSQGNGGGEWVKWPKVIMGQRSPYVKHEGGIKWPKWVGAKVILAGWCGEWVKWPNVIMGQSSSWVKGHKRSIMRGT
jgi:hypothetical protein